ncbi:MAG: type VI secretion system baseplate subunit TssK [Holosporales bacterium]|nr:type VI secretion system baseplate subunit TssK [Holosporales bacterium]
MSENTRRVIPIPLNINWHEGMLLSQHHFQQTDLRNFRVIATQIQLLSSNHFGVRHLRIDTVALSDGLYRIRELEAVFPDGLIFSFFPEKQKNLKSLEIDIHAHMADGFNEVTIYLAIAESSDDISPVLGNPARYYSIDGDVIQDENIKENTVKIPRLFPNGFLHVGESLPEFCIGFPLCKIIRLDGVFHVKNWTPPCFFIERHFPLWKRCETLAISIREKAVYLSEKLKHSATTNTSNDTRSILKQILTVMPGFEALVYSNEVRPYELYQQSAEVLGAVSVLIPEDVVQIMPPYNHNDIDSCLYRVIAQIEHYLSVVERGFSIIPFNKKEIFFFHYINTKDLEKLPLKKLYIGIRGSEDASPSDIQEWMNDAVIVSDFAIDVVRVKRVKGAMRCPLNQEIVSRILPGVGVVLFEVDVDELFIKGEQNLHIFNPGNNFKNQPVEIVWYLPRKRS